jgi:hypothetical protein
MIYFSFDYRSKDFGIPFDTLSILLDEVFGRTLVLSKERYAWRGTLLDF